MKNTNDMPASANALAAILLTIIIAGLVHLLSAPSPTGTSSEYLSHARRAADRAGFGSSAYDLELVSYGELLGSRVLTFGTDNWFSSDVIVVLTVDPEGNVNVTQVGQKQN